MRLEDVIDPAKRRVKLLNGYATDSIDAVIVGGLRVPAFWTNHVNAQENDPVWVLMLDNPDGFSIAVVVGVNGKPDTVDDYPLSGTVSSAPIGSDTVTVSTSAGSIEAAFGSDYVPQVSDKVRLLWQYENAWVLGKSAKIPTPRKKKPKKDLPTVSAPPSSRARGVDSFTASDSATWATGTGSWNSRMGKDVYQGSWPGVGNARGAWFYHNKPSRLRGRRATKVEFWVPARLKAGSYNSSLSLRLYLHYSARRPGGDVRRGSQHTVTIRKGWRGGWVTLPTSWGASLVEGKGIGIAGGSYAGFQGVGSSSKSGQVRISWEK